MVINLLLLDSNGGSVLTAETVSLSGRSVISNGTVVSGVVLRPYSTDDC